MKALVYHGPRSLSVEEWKDTEPGPGEVRLSPHYVGICGSDIHGYTGASGRRIPPMIMGHEIAAVVEKTGANVTSLRVGDRVTVQPIMYCGKCDYCRQGLTNVCAARRGLGVMDVNGAFCERFVMPQANVLQIPEGVSDKAAAMMDPFSVVFRAMKYAAPVKGKTILIIGAGTIGLLFMKLARHFGADKLIVSDLSGERLGIAADMGADLVVNPKEQELPDFLRRHGLEDRVDVVVECVGASVTARQSVDCVRINGLVIWIGNAAKMAEVDMQSVVTRSVRIQGTYGFTEDDFREALEFLSTSGMSIDEIATGVVTLEQAPEAFERLARGGGADLKVLVEIHAGKDMP